MSGRVSRAMARVLMLICVALLAGGSALADSIEVKLNGSAKVYSSLSGSANYVQAPKGLKVTLEAYAKGWGQITYKGKTGYIKLKYLDRVDPLKAYVSEDATVYKDGGGSSKLSTISAGTTVYVVGVDGSYVRIQNKDGSRTGYIKSGKLSFGNSGKNANGRGSSAADSVPESLRATEEGASRSKIEKTIYVAQALIGAPYSSSAEPPKTFDCAKYSAYCYGAAQSNVLKSSSREQGCDDRYEKIAYDDLKRGDLVCFDTVSDDDYSDHVGIYLGGGYFLHGSSAAKKVILSSLSSGYYKRTFSCGRRIFTD